MTHHPPFRSLAAARLLTACAAISLIMFAAPNRALAHTDFDFSIPADGDMVTEAVTEITVAFTQPVTLVGNGFEVLDPQGNLIEPAVTSEDRREFLLTLPEPIAGGATGVRFEVTAEDGHVLADSFSFTVDAPVITEPATTPPPPSTAPPPPPTTAAPTTAPPTIAPTTDVADTDPPPTTTTPATPAVSEAETSVAADSVPSTEPGASDSGSSRLPLIGVAILAVLGLSGFAVARARSGGDPVTT